MQNFHCQFGHNDHFDSFKKNFSLEKRLIWEERTSENPISNPEEVAKHEITPEKLRQAIVEQLRILLKDVIRQAATHTRTRQSISQEVKVGDKKYTIGNEDLVRLGEREITSALAKSKLWEDIKTAIPDISSKDTKIIDLMSLYKVDMASLVPKDTFWLINLKNGLSETDRNQLQELEDAWDGTASQDRNTFRDQMRQAHSEATQEFERQQEEKAAREAIERGEATPAQMRQWKDFTDKFNTRSGTVDKWNEFDQKAKTLTLSGNDFTSFLSIEDLKNTKFVKEDSETNKGKVTFNVTPEQIALYQNIIGFIGGSLGFAQNVVTNMKSNVPNDIADPSNEPGHIEQAREMMEVLANLRQFVAASYVFKKIIEDSKEKGSQEFFRTFYDSSGKLIKSNSKGLGKYLVDLGIKNAITKKEYDNVFLICAPAMKETYDSLLKKEEREKDRKEQEAIADREAAARATREAQKERERIEAEREKARRDEQTRIEQEAEEARKAEEAIRREEREKIERETKDASIRELKEKVGAASTAMRQYLDTVDPNTTQWVNLKDLSEFQESVTDEEIESANEEDTFEDLRKEYIEKAIKIYMRDLRSLNADAFAKKIIEDDIYVESKSSVMQTPGGGVTTIPAKKTYRPLVVFMLALKQTGLSNYRSHYFGEANDIRDELLEEATSAFSLFKKAETPNEDISPKDLAKPEFATIFAQFKDETRTTIAASTPTKPTGSSEIAPTTPDDPFDYAPGDLIIESQVKNIKPVTFNTLSDLFAAVNLDSRNHLYPNAAIKCEVILDRITTAYADRLTTSKEGDKAQEAYKKVALALIEAYKKIPAPRSIEEFDKRVALGEKLSKYNEIFPNDFEKDYDKSATPRTRVTVNTARAKIPFRLSHTFKDPKQKRLFEALEAGVNEDGEIETYIYGEQNPKEGKEIEYTLGTHTLTLAEDGKTITVDGEVFSMEGVKEAKRIKPLTTEEANSEDPAIRIKKEDRVPIEREFILENDLGKFTVRCRPIPEAGDFSRPIKYIKLTIKNHRTGEVTKPSSPTAAGKAISIGGEKIKIVTTTEKTEEVEGKKVTVVTHTIDWTKISKRIGESEVSTDRIWDATETEEVEIENLTAELAPDNIDQLAWWLYKWGVQNSEDKEKIIRNAEAKHETIEGEPALVMARICFAASVARYNKVVDDRKKAKYTDFNENIGAAIELYNKAETYLLASGDATYEEISEQKKTELETAIGKHELSKIRKITVAGLSEHKFERTSSDSGKLSKKVEEALKDLEKQKGKKKIKEEYQDKSGDFAVYLLIGDSIYEQETVTADTTSLNLTTLADEKAARLAEAELVAEVQEEQVPVEEHAAEATEGHVAEPVATTEEEEATVESTEATPEDESEIKEIANRLTEQIRNIDTLPEIGELLLLINPSTRKLSSLTDKLKTWKTILDALGAKIGVNTDQLKEIFLRSFVDDTMPLEEANKTNVAGEALLNKINEQLQNPDKLIALSIMKKLVDAVDKNSWQSKESGVTNDWWQFRAYVYQTGATFGRKIETDSLPFTGNDWAEIKAWFKEKYRDIPESPQDNVVTKQEELLSKLPKLEADGRTLNPTPSIFDLAAIYKGKKALSTRDEANLITHYFGKNVEYKHKDTPERAEREKNISDTLFEIIVYGNTQLKDRTTQNKAVAIWGRLQDINNTTKYASPDAFADVEELNDEEKRELATRFIDVRGGQEKLLADEIESWIQQIITDADIDKALEVTGGNANQKLAALKNPDEIALTLINGKINNTTKAPEGLLVATVDTMKAKLLEDKEFRTKVLTEALGIRAKHEKVKEDLQREESRLVLDETFKQFSAAYPVRQTDFEKFKIDAETKLSSINITFTDKSNRSLWNAALEKAYKELTDLAMKNVSTSLGTTPKMQKAIEGLLRNTSTIPETLSFDEFLAEIAKSNDDVTQFLTYEKNSESPSGETYKQLQPIYDGAWPKAHEAAITERATSAGREQEIALAESLRNLHQAAANKAEELTKKNPKISKDELFSQINTELKASIPADDRFKTEKDKQIDTQLQNEQSDTYKVVIEKAFDTKMAYLIKTEADSEIDEMLKQKADFDQILDSYKLTEFVSKDKKTSYEELAEKFISLTIDNMLTRMDDAFNIFKENNDRRQTWLKGNDYSMDAFLGYYFEIMKVGEFKSKLTTNKEIESKTKEQLDGSEHVKTALLFDVSISPRFRSKVSQADTKTIGKWIYPDRVPKTITDAGLTKMLSPSRYLRWVKDEVFEGDIELFNRYDKDKAEEIIKDFLITNLNLKTLKKTAEEVNEYDEVLIEDLEKATEKILAEDIFIDAATLEAKLIEKFESDAAATKQRIAINSTEGDTTNEGVRFRQLALVAFRAKFEHFKSDTGKPKYSSSEDLRESWLTVYKQYKLETFSPKSFIIFEEKGARHIDRSDPLDSKLGDIMTEAVMYFADIYLKEALQETRFNGVDFRAKFAKQDKANDSIKYDEKLFFRAIAGTKIPGADGNVYKSLEYVTHFLNDFASFDFETRVKGAVDKKVKALDTIYIYSADADTVQSWKDEMKKTSTSYSERQITANQPALDFIKWLKKEKGLDTPKIEDPEVLTAMTMRLISILNNKEIPAEVASKQPEINEWENYAVPEDLFEKEILNKIAGIVGDYIYANNAAPSKKDLFKILEKKFPKNPIDSSSDKYAQIIDKARRVIMDAAKSDTTEISEWSSMVEKYKLDEYIPELNADSAEGITNKYYKEIISSGLAFKIIKRKTIEEAKALTLEIDENLSNDSNSRRSYFDFENQKYDAQKFFEYNLKFGGLPKGLKTVLESKLSGEDKSEIQAILNRNDKNNEMIFIDSLVKIATKDSGEGSAAGPLFAKIQNPNAVYRSWLDDKNKLVIDKFIDWVVKDQLSLVSVKIKRQRIDESTKEILKTIISDNWLPEQVAAEAPVETIIDSINENAKKTDKVKAWANLDSTKNIAVLNEFTKENLLPLTDNQKLSDKGLALVESFITYVSGDETFKKHYSDEQKASLGTLLRNIDYRNYILASDVEFTNRKNTVQKALIEEGLEASATNVDNTREDELQNEKKTLEIQLRIIPHEKDTAAGHASLGILHEIISGTNTKNAENQRSDYFEGLVNGVISTENKQGSLTENALERFYKKPGAKTIQYFKSSAERPEDNTIIKRLKAEVEKIKDKTIAGLAKKELEELENLVKQANKNEADLKHMLGLKNNIESLQYIDETIDRIADENLKTSYRKEILDQLNSKDGSLDEKIKKTGVKVPDFDQLLTLLEETWGYSTLLTSNEEVRDLEEAFEKQFRLQTERSEKTLVNLEHRETLKSFLIGENNIVEKIARGEDAKKEIKDIIEEFSDAEQELVEEIIYVYIIQYTLGALTPEKIATFKSSEVEKGPSFMRYLEYVESKTGLSNEDMHKLTTESLSTTGGIRLKEDYEKIFTGKELLTLTSIYENFYAKDGEPKNYENDRQFREWLDPTTEVLEAKELMYELDILIGNNINPNDEDLKPSIAHYIQTKEYIRIFNENEYSIDIASDIRTHIENTLYIEGEDKTKYDSLTDESERLAFLLKVYKEKTQDKIKEFRAMQIEELESLRVNRENENRPYYGVMLSKARLGNKVQYNIESKSQDEINTMTNFQRLKYYLMRYHDLKLNDLPNSEELTEEQYLYEKGQEAYLGDEKFTLEAISKAIVKQGLKANKNWDEININDIPLANIMLDSAYLGEAVTLYMAGNKDEESVEKRNGFFYRYLRKTYKPKDKANLLALTPDKLTDELTKAYKIPREHLDHDFDIADRLKEYQEETLGEESVTETLQIQEDTLTADINKNKEEGRTLLRKEAEGIQDEAVRGIAERLIDTSTHSAAESFIEGMLNRQRSEDPEEGGPEAMRVTAEYVNRIPDQETTEMFDKVNAFISEEIEDIDQTSSQLRAAQIVVKDILRNTAIENGIRPPLNKSNLGQVLILNNLRVASHLVEAMQGTTNTNPEALDQMLMSLFKNDDAFRELPAKYSATLEGLKETWLEARDKEPQKLTADLLREILRRLPSTEDQIEQIPSKTMLQWYDKTDNGELVFKEQLDTEKIILTILNSFGFRIKSLDAPTTPSEGELANEVFTRIKNILDVYHPREESLGDEDKDGKPDRNYTLQDPYKTILLRLAPPVEAMPFEDAGSNEKFKELKDAFFAAAVETRGRRDNASTTAPYQEVLTYLNNKDAAEGTNDKQYMTLFYEVLMTMQAPKKAEVIQKKDMSTRERAIDAERTKLAEETALQNSLLQQLYRENVLTDAESTIQATGGNKLKDSKVDFSNLQHLSRNVFSEKFKYAVKGGEFLTGQEAQEAYGTALDLLLSSKAADRSIVGFGDFALSKFYKKTKGIEFPFQAKEKFFSDYKDIKDVLEIIAKYNSNNTDSTGFKDGYENETWYKEYKPLAKRTARILYDQIQRNGVLEKKSITDTKTLKFLEEKLLRGEAPESLKMMETEMENYMVSSSKVLNVLNKINEEIGMVNMIEGTEEGMDQTRLYAITGYDQLKSPYNDKSQPEYVSFGEYIERLHLLETQMDIYNCMDKEMSKATSPHQLWLEKWKRESFDKTSKETYRWLKDFGATTLEERVTFLNEILKKYHEGKPEIIKASHKKWTLEEIRQARRFDAMHEDISANNALNDPRTYTDKRFGDLLKNAETDTSLQFENLNEASGPFDELDIAFNYGLTNEDSRLQSFEAIYISKRMRKDFVDALKALDIRPPEKKQKMIDTFRNNPDDIAKLFYAVLGKETVRTNPNFFKVHLEKVEVRNESGDKEEVFRPWAIMDIPEEEIKNFLTENQELIGDLKWKTPTLREIVLAKGTPGFAEFFERGVVLEHIVFDQSEAAAERLQTSENPLDSLIEYTLRIHEISDRGKSIERPSRAELEQKAKEQYTDIYEMYVNRDSAWQQYESNTFVMNDDPEIKKTEELKLKGEYADKLLRDGISTMSFMLEYPITWDTKYDRFIDVDTVHNLYEAMKILFAEDLSGFKIDDENFEINTLQNLLLIRDSNKRIFDANNNVRMGRMSKLKPRHIDAIATAMQFGKIYKKAIEQGTERKQMVFDIFRNERDGAIDIASLLEAQDAMFKANGVDLSADELYRIGDDLRARLAHNTLSPIELSRDMEEAAQEYMDFRTLLAFPTKGYKGIDDEVFMAWKHKVIGQAKDHFTERMQKLIAPFIDGELTAGRLDQILNAYMEIQKLKHDQAEIKPAYDAYVRIETKIEAIDKKIKKPMPREIKAKLEESKASLISAKEKFTKSKEDYEAINTRIAEINERVEEETGIDDSVEKLEKLLVNDYGELLRKAITDLPETDAADFFGGFGMNVDVVAQRAQLGWNAGINLPKGHQIDVMFTVTPGDGAGIQAGGSKEWSNLGEQGRGKVQVFAHGGFNAGLSGTAARLSGGIEYSKLEGGRLESRGSIGAFAVAEVGPGGVKATIGVMASVGELTPEEKEIKYKKELEAGREGILKKEYERIDAYVEDIYGTESSVQKESMKRSIEKAMEDVFLRAVRDAEAGRAAMPKNIEFTRFEMGISVGLDKDIAALGLPIKPHLAFIFSVDGRVFVTRVATPEHIMDEASDNEIMHILEAEGITAGEMTLTSPLTLDDKNMLSSTTAREMIERADEAMDILRKVGEGGEKIYTKDGTEGIALKRAYEMSVALGSLEGAKNELTEDFNKYMDIYRDKIKAAQIQLEPVPGDIHKKRLVFDNTPGVTEIHLDPVAEGLVEIDSDGNMIFDFASGFPIITKEVFEFEAENYGANTVNIITIKFNRHLSRKQIEASEKNYYTVMRNDKDVKSRATKMTPRRAVDLDLTMVEKAKPKTEKEFFKGLEDLYTRAKHIDDMHHKFIDKFGGTEAVDPRYEYISESDVDFIQSAVSAFIPDETNPRGKVEKDRREAIEKYFTLSIKIKEDENKGRYRLEGEDQLDLTPTQIEETEKLIDLIQSWYSGYASKNGRKETELNNYQLQYFLGQMVFETFYNIHRITYGEWKNGGQKSRAEKQGGKAYFISAGEIFSDSGTNEKPGKREKLRRGMDSLSNPIYQTMQNYLAHLHGSGKDMARSVAENYVNNHPIQGQEANRDARIKDLTESLIKDSEQEVHRLIMDKMGLSSIEEAKEYCDFLAYTFFKKNDGPTYDGKAYIDREGIDFTPQRAAEIEKTLKTPEAIKAFYGAYENIFEGSQTDMIHDESAMLLTRLNASFASARHFKYNGWYSAGGRAVEALSANFGGLRKSFIYDLGDPKESEKARAVFEYMRPLPKLGKEGALEYNPLSDVDFFETGDEDIRFAVRQEEETSANPERKRRITTRSELEGAITKAEKLYEDIEITMQDVKEYLSTPMGLKVLEWAGVFLKTEQADIMFELFTTVRTANYDSLATEPVLEGAKKEAFVEFVNINRVLREIEYFNSNPSNKDNAFYTVGLGGTEYEAQIRYIPVERIDNGVRTLTENFETIESDDDFDNSAKEFLEKYAGIDTATVNGFLDNSGYKKNCIDYLKANEKTIGFKATEVDGLFSNLRNKNDVVRQLARIIALSKFTPLSKQERLTTLRSENATKEISRIITQENERQYLNQKNSRLMSDGTVQDVIPVAYIFKSSDPDNVMIVNAGGISATGTFLKCGNWSTLGQEQLALFVQEQRSTVLDGGGAAMTRTGDIVKPETESEYTRISTGVSGSGRIKVTPPEDITHGKHNTDTNSTNNGVNEGYEDIPIDDNGEVDTITGDKGSVTVTPTEAGATTGTSGGTESPEGISLRRGNQNPEITEAKPKIKQPKKKSDDESEEDLSGI